MLRIAFAIFMIIHGAIHSIGPIKAFGLAPVAQLTKPVGRMMGVAWGITAVLFIIAAILFLAHKAWWYVALPAIITSQVLIIYYWHDARFGTIAGLIIGIVALVAWADERTDRQVRQEARQLMRHTQADRSVVTADDLRDLPEVVRQWLTQAGVVGSQKMATMRLRQQGAMRTDPKGKWMDFEAVQYFNANEPAFIWHAHVAMMPLVFLTGRERYLNGKGAMNIRLLSLKDVVNSSGTDAIDQGSMVRYLAEMVWFPTAALNEHFSWKQLDDRTAAVVMTYLGRSATGTLTFDDRYRPICFEAQRYMEKDGKSSLQTWHIDMTDHQLMDGLIIPGKSTVTWKLKEGDFTWLRLELTDIGRDETEPYP